MQDEYDVIVVGAGPAGSTTAKFAAAGGASVLMVEKRQEIGSPVRCGEGITKHFFDYVGITPSERWISQEVEGAKIVSPSGIEFCINERYAGQEVGMVIERDLFDKALAADAARAGAEIAVKTTVVALLRDDGKVVGVRVRDLDGERDVRAGVVVGADGFESQVGRWAGLDTSLKPADTTTALQYRLTNIEADPDYCEFFLGSGAPGGYIWVFPKNEDTANVGIGMQLSKLKRRGDLKIYLDRFIKSNERFKRGQPLDIVAGGLSTCAPLEKTIAAGILLVGDAARQTDPITGGGIANGCKAGRIAGEVLARAAEEGDFSEKSLQPYEDGWRKLLEEALYRNWLAKNKLVTLTDEVFDKIIGTLAEVGMEKLSVLNILKVVEERHPELVEEFQDFL